MAAGLLTMAPGLDTALVIRTALVEGRRSGMLAGAGSCAGCLTWGLATSVGLGALVSASRLAYGTLRVAAAVYLAWLGVRLLLRRDADPALPDAEPSGRAHGDPPHRWFVRGFVTNILNPKVGVFYATLLPLFVPPDVNVTAFSMLLASIHAVEGLFWFFLLTTLTRPLSGWLRRPGVSRAFDRATGALLVGMGVRLALERGR